MPRMRQRGFTIVEILVVIGIISILASLLFVGLRSALGTAAKTRELNSLRNVSLAWTMYSGSNNEYLLPGYLEPSVQDAWRLDWRDANRETLPQELAAPYTWRLAPYVEFSWDALIGYRDDAQKELRALPTDEVAFRPGFGYNGLYVGGWWETVSQGGSTFQAMRYDILTEPGFGGLVARSQGSMQRPSELIVFAASSEQPPGRFRNNDLGASSEGFHLAVPGIVAGQNRWEPELGSASSLIAFTTGPVPLIRHSGGVAVAHADGNVTSFSINEIADQRRWIDIAQDRNWTHPE